MKVAGTHVVVTGASRGIGRHIAEVMSERGARLTVVARAVQPLEKMARELNAVAVPTDLSDLDQVAMLLPKAEAANGPVDILINNAAMSIPGPLLDRTAAELQSVLTTNFLAPIELARAALQSMVKRDSGSVVNVSSYAGEVSLPNLIPYCSSKAGLTSATLGLQRELAGTNVQIHLVIIGVVETDMIRENKSDRVASRIINRFSLMPALPVRDVAVRIAQAVENNRKRLMLPGVGAPIHYIRLLPTYLLDALLAGGPPSIEAT